LDPRWSAFLATQYIQLVDKPNVNWYRHDVYYFWYRLFQEIEIGFRETLFEAKKQRTIKEQLVEVIIGYALV
jgi:hypothetical protein